MYDSSEQSKQSEQSFERLYQRITLWVKTQWSEAQSWIEIGEDEYSRSFVRALDDGGMVWEGREQSEYTTMESTQQWMRCCMR